MAFSHSNHIDASRSTFSDFGHDQINNNVRVNQTIINISLSGSGHTLHHLLGPTSALPQGVLIPKYHSPAVVSIVDTTVSLVVNIVGLLHVESSDKYRRLEGELKSLCQSLILTRSAIQVYEYTSLGQSLANAVYPDVEQCHVVLQEMLDKIIHYRGSLHSTSISGLWRQVWWSGWDGDELASSIMELSACQESLNKFLMALNSYVLFPFHASEPADISRSIINTKCCVDGPWK